MNATASEYSVDELLSNSWDKKIADDIADELGTCSGEHRRTVPEMRRFLAVKGYRELLQRAQAARQGETSYEALRSVAHAMREYALARPGLSAAACRTPTTDSPEWREAHEQLRDFMISLFAECGLHARAADEALHILRSLVRGFVIHEVMDSFLSTYSYGESYDKAMDVFIAGLPVLLIKNSEG
jgi:hypothetical protein